MGRLLEVIFSIFGLLFGLVLVDVDHLFDYAIFHWPPFVCTVLFFGIGLYIFRDRGVDK